MIPSGTAEEAGGTRPPGETDREDRKRKWSEGPDGGPSRVRQKVDSESSDSGNWQQYLNLSEDKEGKAPSESSSDRVRDHELPEAACCCSTATFSGSFSRALGKPRCCSGVYPRNPQGPAHTCPGGLPGLLKC